jgi:hypothetical protein
MAKHGVIGAGKMFVQLSRLSIRDLEMPENTSPNHYHSRLAAAFWEAETAFDFPPSLSYLSSVSSLRGRPDCHEQRQEALFSFLREGSL